MTLATRRALVLLLSLGVPQAVRAAEAPRDLRLAVTALLLADHPQDALKALEKALEDDPPGSGRALGLDYFRGRLLEQLGRDREAAEAFAESLSSGHPLLRAHSRFRLAETQARLGHPEVAAGLVATLLGSDPPPDLLEPAIRLLRDSLADGGDCRVAPASLGRGFPSGWRRRLDLVRAECGARRSPAAGSRDAFLSLLRADTQDEVALEAAEGYSKLGAPGSSEGHRLLGLAFHQHREFGLALTHLELWLTSPGSLDFETRFARARALFWQSRFREASAGFGELAAAAIDPSRRAETLYQQARSLELAGELPAAAAAFRRSYLADPRGDDASAALLSALRVDFGRGLENDAIAVLDKLTSDPAWRSATARGALFLAASDLVRGRSDRAGRWLETARLADARPEEVSYWRGRWFEASKRPEAAVRAYGEAVIAAPWSAWAVSARTRMRSEGLASYTAASGAAWAKGTTKAELQLAWIALGDDDPRGQRARETLRAAYLAEPRSAPFLRAQVLPAAEWPLWRQSLTRTDEVLLTLGGWSEGGSALTRHFPLENPSLALTAIDLAARGGNLKRSVGIAETVAQRFPTSLPWRLLPRRWIEGLYPLPYRELLFGEAKQRGIEPALLAAIVREESRFDPLAVSAASARGLAQFVLPTAKELAERYGLGRLTARDLERPNVALALGAIYLSELIKRSGSVEQAVAAYNAGEPQAALWRKYCVSNEPEEYLSKVSFKETRAYLSRVLTSRNAYAELTR